MKYLWNSETKEVTCWEFGQTDVDAPIGSYLFTPKNTDPRRQWWHRIAINGRHNDWFAVQASSVPSTIRLTVLLLT